ncbi:MAG: polysaccharide deacetylase family protein [Sphingomonadales bacterium]|nr:polysaccharide deacetylase family protein [Sphingomonadales bacterium]MDE2569151.1 polysaccharide deacetylase family protein [Sphingomonadales bacterium]
MKRPHQHWLKAPRLAAALAALSLSALTAPAVARTHSAEVALTFDDLPSPTLNQSIANVTAINRDLLAGLRRHHMRATGFVNEGKLDAPDRAKRIALLRLWLRKGMDLGNHTYSHASPDKVGAAAYVADIARGEPVTAGLLATRGRTLHWFRHPYLETGSPAPVRAQIDAWLQAHHYEVAPVTLQNSDWMFADLYETALAKGDTAGAQHIRSTYLDYTARMIDWYRAAAHSLFGRDIAYVFLLHDSRLNADSLDALAALLKRDHMRVVTLDKAMRDPAYRTPDTYAGPDGIDWMERWSDSLHKAIDWSTYSDPPAAITAAYDKLESDNTPTH